MDLHLRGHFGGQELPIGKHSSLVTDFGDEVPQGATRCQTMHWANWIITFCVNLGFMMKNWMFFCSI
jgi:hypothetical protein